MLRRRGDVVRAGTLNVGADELLVVTTAAAGDTAVARMAALVEAAASQQSPAEAAVARFARFYTPAIMLACVAAAALPWLLGASGEQRTVRSSRPPAVSCCRRRRCALALAWLPPLPRLTAPHVPHVRPCSAGPI